MDQERPQLLLSLEETAEFFGVSDPTMRDWIKRGAPVVEGGARGIPYKLDPNAIQQWRAQQQAEDEAAKEQKLGAMNQLRLELLGQDSLTAKAGTEKMTKAEMAHALSVEYHRTKLAEKRGELVQADGMKLLLASIFARLRDGLRSMPDIVCRQLGLGDDVAGAMLEQIDDNLRDLAAGLATLKLEDQGAPPGDGNVDQQSLIH